MMKKLLCLLLCSLFFLFGFSQQVKLGKKPKEGEYPVFTQKDSLRGMLCDARCCFDVHYYDLDVVFDIKKKSIEGKTTIAMTAMNDFKTIQLDLYQNLTINAVMYQGKLLSFTRKFDAFFVTFENEIKKGEQLELLVEYKGVPRIARKPPWEGGFVWKKDKHKNPWVGVSCELDGASLWWPLKDHLSDEPDSASVRITVDSNLYCVSNGKLVEITEHENQKTFHWKINYPINTYNISFYIGDYRSFSHKYSHGESEFDMNFYVLSDNLEIAKSHFLQAEPIIQFFEEIYGSYPWKNDGYKLVESPYEGMEHQSAIAYGHGFKNTILGFDYIILHETAHEWWGNSVSVSDYADIWIHEGFATYSEALYVEHTLGHEHYLKYLMMYRLMIENKLPVVGPRDVNFWNYKDTDPYLKGALTLHSLRETLANDSLFFNILKSFYQENTMSIVTTQDFVDHVNQKTGQDFSTFFKIFLYEKEPPKLKYKMTYNATTKKHEFYYKWMNTSADFKMPIVMKVRGKNMTFYPTTTLQMHEFDCPVADVLFDLSKAYYTVRAVTDIN